MIKQTWAALAAALCCFASPAQAASPDETQVAAERLLGSDSEQAQWQSYLPVTRKLHAWGVVVGSLTASTEAAGVPPAAMIEAVQALATAIDPERDVKGGDLFWVQYEQEYTVEGDPIGTGRVLWAELRTAAKGTVAIHRFRIGKSSAEPFWLATGQSTETTAVRLPLNRISITSAFGLRADPFDQPMSPAWAIGPVRVTPSGNPKPKPANTLGKGNSAVDAEGRAMKTRAGASLTPLGLSMGLSPVPSRGAAAPSGAAARVVAPHTTLVMHANRGEHRTGREWRKRSSARRRSWTSRENVPRPRSARMRNDARLRVAWRQVLGRRHFTDERAEASRRGKYLTCPVWVEAVARRSRDETIPVLRTYSSKV